ncbi:MAG: class I tRNA ligase family protein, partial [bacterium]|nr:class I tRNA ligase family protein [bacterium]
HPNQEPVRQKEENYFFKLSSFEKQLTDLIEKDEYKILPGSRKNEVLGKLKLGLQDTSVSRARVSWGIPVPWDKKQTIYVWVEALFNYYTATQFNDNKNSFWPADLHIVGKDILWFHAIIWPALLLAAELPLPKTVFAHGFFTINGQKMSKSLGNVISPEELVEKYGSDASRYLLLSEFPFGEDGDFSFDKLTQRYNADLANGLGNLVSRVAKLAEQSGLEFPGTDEDHKADDYHQAMENLDLYNALGIATHYVRDHNQYIDQKEPWTLLKEKKTEELKETLEHLVKGLRATTKLVKPFLPQTAEKIEKQFSGPRIATGEPLFPRLA